MSISANQITTGNLFLYYIGEDGLDWEPTVLDWQDIKWCDEDPVGFNKVHKPLPLSEELLLNGGFSDEFCKKGLIAIDTPAGSFVLVKPNEECPLYSFKYFDLEWLPKVIKFEFVHELQNFFFTNYKQDILFSIESLTHK